MVVSAVFSEADDLSVLVDPFVIGLVPVAVNQVGGLGALDGLGEQPTATVRFPLDIDGNAEHLGLEPGDLCGGVVCEQHVQAPIEFVVGVRDEPIEVVSCGGFFWPSVAAHFSKALVG